MNRVYIIPSIVDETNYGPAEYGINDSPCDVKLKYNVDYHKYSDDVICVAEMNNLKDLFVAINTKTKMLNISSIIDWCKLNENDLIEWLFSDEGLCVLDICTKRRLNKQLITYSKDDAINNISTNDISLVDVDMELKPFAITNHSIHVDSTICVVIRNENENVNGLWVCYELVEPILMMYNRVGSNDRLFMVVKNLDSVIRPLIML